MVDAEALFCNFSCLGDYVQLQVLNAMYQYSDSSSVKKNTMENEDDEHGLIRSGPSQGGLSFSSQQDMPFSKGPLIQSEFLQG